MGNYSKQINAIDGSSRLDDIIAQLGSILDDFSIAGGPRREFCQRQLHGAMDKLFALRGEEITTQAHTGLGPMVEVGHGK